MKKLQKVMMLFVALSLLPLNAFADPTAISGSGSVSDATAIGVGGMGGIGYGGNAASGSVSTAGATSISEGGVGTATSISEGGSAVIGNTTSTSSVGDTVAHVGNTTATVGTTAASIGAVSPAQTMIVNAPHAMANLPINNFPVNNPVNIFGPLAESQPHAGLIPTVYFNNICPTVVSRNIKLEVEDYGTWREMHAKFVPHITYAKQRRDFPNVLVDEVEQITWNMPPRYVQCVGVVSATVHLSKTEKSSLATLQNLVMQKLLENIVGHQKVLVYFTGTVATSGVESDTSTFGVSFSSAGTPGAGGSMLGGGVGLSLSGSDTYPGSKVGFTVLVFAPSEQYYPGAVLFEPNILTFTGKPQTVAQANGNNGQAVTTDDAAAIDAGKKALLAPKQ